jgi:hypothetical protein
MPVSHRQTGDKEKNNAARKKREQCRRDKKTKGIIQKRKEKNRKYENIRKLKDAGAYPVDNSAVDFR